MAKRAWNTTRPDGEPPPSPPAKAGLSLIRQAQWATTVLGTAPEWPIGSATAAQLEEYVRRAESRAGTTRARRVDLFPRLTDEGMYDTLIASTLRWLLYVGGTVTRRIFMTEYHVRSTREKRGSRSSFVNNVGPYCRGAGAVLALVDPEGKPLNVYGNYHDPKRHPALSPHPNHRTGVFVRWVGPSIETWLAVMLDADLDRALQALERQLIGGDEGVGRVSSPPDETAWWLGVVRAEINRRATGEPYVVTPGAEPPRPTKPSRQKSRAIAWETSDP